MDNYLTIEDVHKALDQYILVATHSSARSNRAKTLSYNPLFGRWLVETRVGHENEMQEPVSRINAIKLYNKFKV